MIRIRILNEAGDSMKPKYKVALKRYNQTHLSELESFRLPEKQEQFTALPKDMLEVSDVRHPIVITGSEVPVGFFVLNASERVKEYTDNPDAMLLTAFSINYVQQGKGYAKLGMQQLKDFVNHEFPTCNEVVLAVNHRNIPAQKLYESVGFVDTGRRKIGNIGEQYILSLSV
jgi:RimJ/RimL family protein N-acetyltransferase